ncbi:DHH family phosphoesterase [bacterium]|nr:DHH family phosphoesterase [bacterium]
MKSFDSKLITTIDNSNKLLITSHLHPDGDAAGSAIGLARSLRKAGKTVDIAWASSVNGRFGFLFSKETVISPEELTGPYDCAIILDIGSENRTGFREILRGLNCPIINIDHHATNKGFCKIDHVDIYASSTCQVIYYLIIEAGWPMDAEIAEAIYLGLVTDSRHFQNASVTAETFQAAAALKATGLNTTPIIQRLVQDRSETELRVLGMALTKHVCHMDGKIAMVTIRQSDLQPLGANHRHAWSSGVFGYLISLGSALVSASLIEDEDGRVFCEFRAKNGFDVSGIAASFGGGGHRGASGCSRTVDIETFRDEVLAKLKPMIKDFSTSFKSGIN